MVRILHSDRSVRLGENRPDQSSEAFNCYAPFVTMLTFVIASQISVLFCISRYRLFLFFVYFQLNSNTLFPTGLLMFCEL